MKLYKYLSLNILSIASLLILFLWIYNLVVLYTDTIQKHYLISMNKMMFVYYLYQLLILFCLGFFVIENFTNKSLPLKLYKYIMKHQFNYIFKGLFFIGLSFAIFNCLVLIIFYMGLNI